MILDLLPALATRRLILASASPRRIELLTRLGLQPIVIPSTFAEDLPHGSDASQYAIATATEKAKDVASSLLAKNESWDLLLACDSIVVDANGKILEKAADEAHAAAMISSLSGSTSQVISALIVLSREEPLTKGTAVPLQLTDGDGSNSTRVHMVQLSEVTTVQFAQLSSSLISAYVATGAWKGKAGAYGIQDVAAQFITGIQGDYYNVMGLPLYKACKVLREILTDVNHPPAAAAADAAP